MNASRGSVQILSPCWYHDPLWRYRKPLFTMVEATNNAVTPAVANMLSVGERVPCSALFAENTLCTVFLLPGAQFHMKG